MRNHRMWQGARMMTAGLASRARLRKASAARLLPNRRIAEGGFTLVELLVVLGIVGMLATLMAPRVLGYFSTAKTQTAQIQAKNITAALELYYLDVGNYPTTEQGLQALITPPAGAAGWHGPYLKNQGGLLDPWHRRYGYRIPGRSGEFDVYSQGHETPGSDVASTRVPRLGNDPG